MYHFLNYLASDNIYISTYLICAFIVISALLLEAILIFALLKYKQKSEEKTFSKTANVDFDALKEGSFAEYSDNFCINEKAVGEELNYPKDDLQHSLVKPLTNEQRESIFSSVFIPINPVNLSDLNSTNYKNFREGSNDIDVENAINQSAVLPSDFLTERFDEVALTSFDGSLSLDVSLLNIDTTKDYPFSEQNSPSLGTFRSETRCLRSFYAKLCKASDVIKERYTEIKTHLMSYSGIKSRTSWYYECFRFGSTTVAKFTIIGKTLYLFLAADTKKFVDKYRFTDVSDVKKYSDAPMCLKIKSERAVSSAKEIIDYIALSYNCFYHKKETDYYPLFRTTQELITEREIKTYETSNTR